MQFGFNLPLSGPMASPAMLARLAAEGEAIGYRLATPHDGGPTGPAVLAGPTCDGDYVLYREVQLPLALAAGDPVPFLAAGAYTASYSSVGFNGLPPLPVHCHDRSEVPA